MAEGEAGISVSGTESTDVKGGPRSPEIMLQRSRTYSLHSHGQAFAATLQS
jgi:hypothetical protein